MKINSTATQPVSTTNACKLCAPLGAAIAFKGIKNCVPLIHGSQGCATYIRRYLISHYREPVDIASSNFSEESTIFGGGSNFGVGIDNIIRQYHPQVIGIASTCLSETIGDDVGAFLYEYKNKNRDKVIPSFVSASTPSYQGTHMEGFQSAMLAIVHDLAVGGTRGEHVDIFAGFVSCADLRYIKEIFNDFGLEGIMVSDYSETLDNTIWGEYKRIPDGGTCLEDIRRTGCAKASIEFGNMPGKAKSGRESASEFLEQKFAVKRYIAGLPIGVKETDCFFEILKELAGIEAPVKYNFERGRLIDSYVDGHKYVFGKRAIVYGEEDLAVGVVSFLEEIGVKTVLCASGGESGRLEEKIKSIIDKSEIKREIIVKEGADFEEINEQALRLSPDIIIGNSKGYYIARRLKIPLVRVGFPVHDRIGAQRIMHLGYRGAQQLFDRIANALIQYKQDSSSVGYKYM